MPTARNQQTLPPTPNAKPLIALIHPPVQIARFQTRLAPQPSLVLILADTVAYFLTDADTGNALQLATELQFAVAGNPKDSTSPSLAGQIGIAIRPFPDWKCNWAADREMTSKYRHYLVHEGLVYTVHDKSSGKVLVLGRDAFAARVNWKHAEASYAANPSAWQSLVSVCLGIFGDTVAFIDLTYERLLAKMDPLLVNPAYQRLWGWDDSHTPAAWPTPQVYSANSSPVSAINSLQACSASKIVA